MAQCNSGAYGQEKGRKKRPMWVMQCIKCRSGAAHTCGTVADPEGNGWWPLLVQPVVCGPLAEILNSPVLEIKYTSTAFLFVKERPQEWRET